MISDKGSELIHNFIEVITEKIQERKYSWEFLKGFNSNCKKVLSTLPEDKFPQVNIFRPLNLPPSPGPDPYPFPVDIQEMCKFNKPYPEGGV
jgi:hypothetical protein